MTKNKTNFQFAASCLLLVFVFLGYCVKFYPQWLAGFDQYVTRLLRGPFPNWNNFYLTITKMGNALSVIVITLALLLFFIWRKWYAESLWLASSVLVVGGILVPLLKLSFTRQRPTLVHLVTETSYSFPSGHAASSMAFYGCLIFILALLMKNKPLRTGLQVLLGLLILGIGVSRIYLGVHFPTDILAGYCLGLAWLLFTFPYFQLLRFKWRFTNKQN